MARLRGRVSETAETRGELGALHAGPQDRLPVLPLLADGQARTIAIMNNDWQTPICRGCCDGLIPARQGGLTANHNPDTPAAGLARTLCALATGSCWRQ